MKKPAKKKWRQDGSIYAGTKRTAMLVNGRDGEYPTLFIEARCGSKADVRWFEQAVEKIFKSLNG
jgi:hypothetical protein